MNKFKQWVISSDQRVFEVQDDKIFIEYQGKPLLNPILVIEKSAYDKVIKENKHLSKMIEELIKVSNFTVEGIANYGISPKVFNETIVPLIKIITEYETKLKNEN